MNSKRMRVAIGLVAVLVPVAIVLTVTTIAASGEDRSMTAVAAQATARFHDLDQAKAAGWGVLVVDKAGLSCIQDLSPLAQGGMGVHWANGSLLGNAEVNPTEPEALVYAPNAAGQPKLAALEYIVFDGLWRDAGHVDAAGNTIPPVLFDHQFALSPDGNRFGIPAFWSLHVWIWQPNDAGTFQPWNPRVQC
jgi:hypothetical protein